MKVLLVFLFAVLLSACEKSSEQSSKATVATATKAIEEVRVARGQVFEHGIYNAQRKGRVLGSLTTNTGKVVTRPVLELGETTDRIPLLQDTYFAYRYRLLGLPKDEVKKPAVELRKVLVHPTMTLPDGSTSTGWDRVVRARTSAGQVIAFDGYVFNEEYELVEGEWIFQIWFNDQMLVEQKFTTYQADEVAADVKTVAPIAGEKI